MQCSYFNSVRDKRNVLYVADAGIATVPNTVALIGYISVCLSVCLLCMDVYMYHLRTYTYQQVVRSGLRCSTARRE